jgi:hypothetical protein
MKNVIIALKNDTLRHFFNAKMNRYGTFLTLLDRFKNHVFYERKRMKKLALFLTDVKKNIVLYSFYKPFCRTCLLYSTRRCGPRALKNACDKMVSYKTRIINNYFLLSVTNGLIIISKTV